MSLRILLTNDDGWAAPGIRALEAGLRAAGHEVFTIAPAENQSGASARIGATGKLSVMRPDGHDNVWAVSGSPADSVIFGLSHVLSETPPDIVVSGANAGANAGQAVHFSGTVGAAVCATSFGVPAIAVSTDLAWDHAAELADFDTTTRVTVALLEWGTPADLVHEGTVLNVNVPAPGHERTPELAATQPDRLPMGRMGYSEGEGDGEFALTFAPGPPAEEGTDTAAVKSGLVSLSAVAVTGHLDDSVAAHLERVASADLTL